nr:RNA-dependent RNA polymerase [Sobelivirales sp.]
MFFGSYLSSESKTFPKCPNMKGVGFEGINMEMSARRMHEVDRKARSTGKRGYKSDVSGWEKGFSLGTARAFAACFRRTCLNYKKNSREIEIMLHWWMYSLLGGVRTDGTNMFVLNREQGMGSGNLLTTSANGAGRCAAAFAAGSTWVITNGDDCLEWSDLSPEELMENYARLNVLVRDFDETKSGFYHFCSHAFMVDQFGLTSCYLSECDKMIFKTLIKNKIDLMAIESMAIELINHPDQEMVGRFFDELFTLYLSV